MIFIKSISSRCSYFYLLIIAHISETHVSKVINFALVVLRSVSVLKIILIRSIANELPMLSHFIRVLPCIKQAIICTVPLVSLNFCRLIGVIHIFNFNSCTFWMDKYYEVLFIFDLYIFPSYLHCLNSLQYYPARHFTVE